MKRLRDLINNSYTECLKEIEQFVQKIHGPPELSEEETLACKFQVELLEKGQFDVEKKYKRIDTAFNATYGEGHPNICILSEYDALLSLSGW